MENPWFIEPSLAASGTIRSRGTIQLVHARLLSVTGRCTYNASATGAVSVHIYYSPDGKHWDTTPYASYQILITAGTTVQRTAPIDVPEHGFIRVDVANADATYAATNLKVWYSISSYPERGLAPEGVTP